MTIYTKKGDKGETGLPGHRRLPKTDALFEFLGSLDQTNAQLGLAVSLMTSKEPLQNKIQAVQRTLLGIGACLAAENPKAAPILSQLDELTAGFERDIDEWDAALPELKNFILPGGTSAAAALHIARTLTRQTERAFHRLETSAELAPVSRFLNRLSDYCFQGHFYLTEEYTTYRPSGQGARR